MVSTSVRRGRTVSCRRHPSSASIAPLPSHLSAEIPSTLPQLSLTLPRRAGGIIVTHIRRGAMLLARERIIQRLPIARDRSLRNASERIRSEAKGGELKKR